MQHKDYRVQGTVPSIFGTGDEENHLMDPLLQKKLIFFKDMLLFANLYSQEFF